MSVQVSLGTKKKSYPSIMAAAIVAANATGEPVEKVYMRMYMRMRAGAKAVTAMNKPARKYVKKGQTIN